jgi:hypothetical protein
MSTKVCCTARMPPPSCTGSASAAKLRNVLHSTDLHVRAAMLQEFSPELDKTREAARAELQFAKQRYTQRRNAGFI